MFNNCDSKTNGEYKFFMDIKDNINIINDEEENITNNTENIQENNIEENNIEENNIDQKLKLFSNLLNNQNNNKDNNDNLFDNGDFKNYLFGEREFVRMPVYQVFRDLGFMLSLALKSPKRCSKLINELILPLSKAILVVSSKANSLKSETSAFADKG
mgnify:CR=1 FL=1